MFILGANFTASRQLGHLLTFSACEAKVFTVLCLVNEVA
jgi:hypothetical protein